MKKLKIEVADTPLKLQYGLMDRRNLEADRGMLFKFPYLHYPQFWMRNTYIPLDIAFLDDDGKILQIENMRPLTTNAHYSKNLCRMALEVNQGWFKKNNIQVGSFVLGEGITHRKGRCVIAQGFMGRLKNIWDKLIKPKDPKDKTISKPEEKKEPSVKDNSPNSDVEDIDPPEAVPEGEYPTTLPMEPIEEGTNPDVDYFRDMRGKIRFAEEHNLPMEIIYWTLRGHMLPPRKVQPIKGEGYPIRKSRNGEYLVAFDISPNISGGGGWTIKGMQPKSFLLDNIINIALIDQNGQEIPSETVEVLKAQEKGQQPQQQQQKQQQQQQQQPKSMMNQLDRSKPMPKLQEGIKEFKKES